VAFLHHEERTMPSRTASLNKRISANGQALHRAMLSRTETYGADHEPSEAESALIEERRQLKLERDKRKTLALQPRPSAVDRLVRTHHAQPKDRPKDRKETKEAPDAKGAKPAKPHKSRAEKHAAKAATLDAARRSPKKPAK
jgi:hypothetical protein